jgi:hypothetical protein
MWQAYRLHYEKRLAVYPRPEPMGAGADADAGTDAGREWNDPHRQASESGRGIEWQPASIGERWAREIVEGYLRSTVASREASTGADGISLSLTFSYPARPIRLGDPSRASQTSLCIHTSDPKFFTNLLLRPSALVYLVLAPEQGTRISSPDLFTRLFSIPPEDARVRTRASGGRLERLTRRVQAAYMMHLFAHSDLAPEPAHLVCLAKGSEAAGYVGIVDAPPRSGAAAHISLVTAIYNRNRKPTPTSLRHRVMLLAVLLLHVAAEWAEEWVMGVLGARFVSGREPWKVWERALGRDYARRGEGDPAGARRAGGAEVAGSDGLVEAPGGPGSAKGSDVGVGSMGGSVSGNGSGSEEGEWVDLGSVRYE